MKECNRIRHCVLGHRRGVHGHATRGKRELKRAVKKEKKTVGTRDSCFDTLVFGGPEIHSWDASDSQGYQAK